VRSVADTLREEDALNSIDLSVQNRIDLALLLGREAVRLYASYHRTSQSEAAETFRRNNQRGRRRCADDDQSSR